MNNEYEHFFKEYDRLVREFFKVNTSIITITGEIDEATMKKLYFTLKVEDNLPLFACQLAFTELKDNQKALAFSCDIFGYVPSAIKENKVFFKAVEDINSEDAIGAILADKESYTYLWGHVIKEDSLKNYQKYFQEKTGIEEFLIDSIERIQIITEKTEKLLAQNFSYVIH